MYNIAMYFVQLGIAIAAIFDHKVRLLWRGQRAAFKTLKKKVDPNAKYVWVHAASLGEFEQGRPIIERIRLQHPEYKILLTFFSPSGYQVRKNYEGADIITYLPIDTVTNARRFLRTIRPVMAFFIKYEFWYNYLHILKHRGVPTYSVSSIFRPDQIFFRWYGRAYSRVLKCFTKFFVQNEESRQLLAKIGITETEIVGDTRFDRVMTIKSLAKQLPIVEAFVGGTESPSTPEGESRPFRKPPLGEVWRGFSLPVLHGPPTRKSSSATSTSTANGSSSLPRTSSAKTICSRLSPDSLPRERRRGVAESYASPRPPARRLQRPTRSSSTVSDC